MSDYRVRAVVIAGRDMTLKTVERTFKSAAARTAWIDKQADAGTLHQVLGYSDDEPTQ